jgi:hypothetical protein
MIAVYENDTDSNRYVTNNIIESGVMDNHQFARAHSQLLNQWNSYDSLTWTFNFSAPNMVSNIQLSSSSDLSSSVDEYFTGEICKVRGTYLTAMTDVNGVGDVGFAEVIWFNQNQNELDSYSFTSGDILGDSYSDVTDRYEILSTDMIGSGYQTIFQYGDSDVCGDSYTSSTYHYCSGIFNIGFKYSDFTVMRSSLAPTVFIDLPVVDNVPTYDIYETPGTFKLETQWKDNNGTQHSLCRCKHPN